MTVKSDRKRNFQYFLSKREEKRLEFVISYY